MPDGPDLHDAEVFVHGVVQVYSSLPKQQASNTDTRCLHVGTQKGRLCEEAQGVFDLFFEVVRRFRAIGQPPAADYDELGPTPAHASSSAAEAAKFSENLLGRMGLATLRSFVGRLNHCREAVALVDIQIIAFVIQHQHDGGTTNAR